MTEKLFYADSHLRDFAAQVLECESAPDGFAVVLDRTAFFPGGGGQAPDTGYIGKARVNGVREEGGRILHIVSSPLEEGARYDCRLDWEQRFSRMQNHSGEHIVSGLAHKIYGCDNVGFHMGEEFVTIDFSAELGREELAGIERLANEAVWRDIPVTAEFPPADALERIDYRSKKELDGDVRIVTIPGVDCCACCAPHVARTGEIGSIKILGSMRHRGGVRLDMVCGADAYENHRAEHESVAAISAALSAKQTEVAAAVDRLNGQCAQLGARCGELSRQLVSARLAAMEFRQGNIVMFDELLSEPALRELVNGAADKCTGVAAVFFSESAGSFRYIIGSSHIDLRAGAAKINSGIGGRGGGSSGMIQGSASCSRKDIQNFFSIYKI